MDNITIIIPYYNRKATIDRALNSIWAQSHKEYDVLIVDDGSDEPLKIDDQRVRIIRHDRNKGTAAARNKAIENAKGPWLAFLDSDDEWMPEKLEKQMAFMMESGAKASVTNARYGDKERHLPKEITRHMISSGQGVSAGSTLIIHRDVYDDVGLQDPSLKRLEDWEWWIRFYQKGHCLSVAPFIGSIIHIGHVPNVRDVRAAALEIVKRFKTHPDFGLIKAAAFLEIAACYAWTKSYARFLAYWFKAFHAHPVYAVWFVLKRLKRAIQGDAPRLKL